MGKRSLGGARPVAVLEAPCGAKIGERSSSLGRFELGKDSARVFDVWQLQYVLAPAYPCMQNAHSNGAGDHLCSAGDHRDAGFGR